MSGLGVGQKVKLQDGRIATVRYVGSAHFANGDWIGVELGDASGKNDGSVQGETYFECAPGHGMFVRPTVVTLLSPRQSLISKERSNGVVSKRPQPQGSAVTASSSSTKASNRQSISTISAASTKRQSVKVESPPRTSKPSTISKTLRSPTKSPTKQLASSASSAASTPRTGTPSTTALRSRPSGNVRPPMGPPAVPTAASRASRQSITRPTPGTRTSDSSATSSRLADKRSSLRPGLAYPAKRLNSVGGESQASESSGQESQSPPIGRQPGKLPSNRSEQNQRKASVTDRSTRSQGQASTQSPTSPTLTQRSLNSNVTVSREVEDLKTKLRMLERKRMEDRDKLKGLEKVHAERDKFEGIIQKLQAKYQPQQQEINDLRKQLKDSIDKVEQIETSQAESDVVLEMATLDREMSEEVAASLRLELESARRKAEELELEVEVLREENLELGGEMNPEQKASQGWLQMERSNERLREALMRLRDLTEENELELKDQVKSLEADVGELSAVKEKHDATKAKLHDAEGIIEDLKQQLELAESGEAIIEEMGERNEKLAEQLDELKSVIEDLESLKELNDELELNHVETEKQLQDEIDFKDSLLAEQARRTAQLEGATEDYEYTIARFRDLVTNLQSDLEDMKASQQLNETEAEELTNRSRAMMDLNMKLQVSASKTLTKTLDLELKRLDAEEAAEHLAIVQLFLPESFQDERDSILALLRFRRVGFKASLVHGFVRERLSGQESYSHEEEIFAGFQVLDCLTWVVSMCERFVDSITSCSVEDFARFEGALYELEPVERALNGWIDGLRRDELKHRQCASDLQRTMALMSHLAEIHIEEGLRSYADNVHMRAVMMQSHLENSASGVAQIKALSEKKINVEDGDAELAQYFQKRADLSITQCRSAKVVVGKMIRSLAELRSRHLSLSVDTLPLFEKAEGATRELSEYSRRLGDAVVEVLTEEGRSEAVTYADIQSSMSQVGSTMFSAVDGSPFETFVGKIRSLATSIADLYSLSADLSFTHEFERPTAPWVLRAEEIRSAKLVPVDTEEELRRLKDDVQERATQLRMREKTLEEAAVKIELLEARTRDAGKKTERIAELEGSLGEAKSRERDLIEAIESQVRELQAMEMEREKLRKAVTERRAVGDTAPIDRTTDLDRAPPSPAERVALKLEIQGLEAAIRYLRDDSKRVRMADAASPAPKTSAASAVAGGKPWLETPVGKANAAAAAQKQQARQPQQHEEAGLAQSEGGDMLTEMRKASSSAGTMDFQKQQQDTPSNRLAWRPTSKQPSSQLRRKEETWEGWNDWKTDLSHEGGSSPTPHFVSGPAGLGPWQASAISPPNHAAVAIAAAKWRKGQRQQQQAAAKIKVRLPGHDASPKYLPASSSSSSPMQVRIAQPGEFEHLQQSMGLYVH
ncbi:MAG: hypothetical protein M1825_001619 [Sarcosagium campestre]|nr:MAG: hypothetical protein M1825_001619 [Sarcosagium campestre]